MSYEIRARSFAEILDMGFRLLANHFKQLFSIALLINLPVFLCLLSFTTLLGTSPAAAYLLLGVGVVLSLGAVPLTLAAVTDAVAAVYLGRPASVAGSLRRTASILLPLVGTGLIAALVIAGVGVLVYGGSLGIATLSNRLLGLEGVAAGTVFGALWVGASFVFVRFAMNFALLFQVMGIEERFGPEALGRSRELMRGNLLRGSGVVALTMVLTWVLTVALQLALGFVPLGAELGSVLLGAASSAFQGAVVCVLYFDIRCRKEAFDLEHLARVVEARPDWAPPSPA